MPEDTSRSAEVLRAANERLRINREHAAVSELLTHANWLLRIRARRRHRARVRLTWAACLTAAVLAAIATWTGQPVIALAGSALPLALVAGSAVALRVRPLPDGGNDQEALALALADAGGVDALDAAALAHPGPLAVLVREHLRSVELTSAQQEVAEALGAEGFAGSVADLLEASRRLA